MPKVPQPRLNFIVGPVCARPDVVSAFSPIYCAEHFFSGPWPCSCEMGPQVAGLQSIADEINYGGARGGAKTATLLVFMIKGNFGFVRFEPDKPIRGADATYAWHPNYRGLILIEQANDLDYIIDRAEAIYGPMGAKITRGNPAGAAFPSGAKITFGYFGEDGWKKYLGPEYQRIAFDQMEKMPKRETHDRILGSLRSRWPELRPQAFSTWNPGGGEDLKGAPGQAWIMDYFHVDLYLSGQFLYRQPIIHPSGKTTLFIPSKVTDNPFLRWKFEKSEDGRLFQVFDWKCKTCGHITQAIVHPDKCENRACLTNKVQ